MRFVFGAVICMRVFPAYAQFQQYRSYDVKDGLPSSDVYSMLQDVEGYLWFTTDMGVSRYDGYSFKNFSNEDGLADNTIFRAYQDDKKRIWFTSFSGKLSYFENGTIHSLPCNAKLEQLLKGSFMTSLYVDKGDTIWAGTTKNFALKILPGWKESQVNQVMFPNTEGYFCRLNKVGFIYGGGHARGQSIGVYENTSKKVFTIAILSPRSSLSSVRYSCIQIADGSFVLTADNSVTFFDMDGKSTTFPLSTTGISIFEELNGEIQIGTYDGALKFRRENFKEITRVEKFERKIVTSILRDREGGLWYCTEGNGVFNVAHSNFKYYTVEDGLSESKISCATAFRNSVVTGHLDGSVSVLAGKSIASLAYQNQNNLAQPNRITSLLNWSNGKLIASTGVNLFTVNEAKQSLELLLASGGKKIISSVTGGIWALHYSNIIQLNPESSEIIQDISISTFTDNIYEDRSGTLWICAINGLWKYDKLNGLEYLGSKFPILSARIIDLKENADGSLWMVSRGHGVIVKFQNTFYQIKVTDGLIGNMCRSLFLDSNSVVWVGTNNGLSKIEYSNTNGFKYEIDNYSSQHGLLTNEVNHILRVKNLIWTFHTSGISVFDPSSLNESGIPPPIYITQTIVNGDTIGENEVLFDYNQNYFHFSFVGLSFKDPGSIIYRYKLEGVDVDWITTSYTSVQYQTLPPGNYRFVVEARNRDGEWSAISAVRNFTIQQAWWQIGMFKLCVIITNLIVISLLFRWRIKHIRKRDFKKAELQNRVASFELSALRAQMNPHFVFNAINSVQYFITNNDPDSSQKYLSKFAKLIRYVVDNSKLTTIPVKQEIEALTLYLELEGLRFGDRFEYTIIVDSKIDVEYMQIPSMLIQPYVENAIWHGIMHKKGNGKIVITLEKQDSGLHCTIEDNGIGRQKSLEIKKGKGESDHKSVGLSNTRERLEIINQVNESNMNVSITDLYDTDGLAVGTKVEIHIPLS